MAFIPPEVVLNGISHDIRRTLSGIATSFDDVLSSTTDKNAHELVKDGLVLEAKNEIKELRKILSGLVNDADDGSYRNFSSFQADIDNRVSSRMHDLLKKVSEFRRIGLDGFKDKQYRALGRQLDEVATSIRRTRASLLALSKFADVDRELHYQEINLKSEIERVEFDLKNVFRRANLSWADVVEISGEGTIETSQFAVASIFGNLVTNSIVHGEKKKIRVRISIEPTTLRAIRASFGGVLGNVKSSNGWVCITVEDNGVGIRKSDLHSVFELFKKAGTRRGKSGGDGVGLSLVAYSLQLLGGGLSLESSRRSGARFSIFLPNGRVSGTTERELFYVGPYRGGM